MDTRTFNAELARDVAKYVWDPLGFQRYAYPWGQPGVLETSPGPRKWQAEISKTIGQHLQNPQTRHQPCLVAVAAGHDIGKSAQISMLTNWAMSTCENTRAIITANTDTQLRTKTWPEVNKWFRLAINGHWFQVNAESVTIRDPKLERLWRTDRVTWSVQNTEAFAGLHNKGRRILVVFDEASAIDDKVYEVTEGALIDEGTEIIWVVFGNPTRTQGRFRECFGKFKHRWYHFQIDSRTVEGTNKEQLQRYVDDYGEDSDFVRVRVRGEFPRAGSDQFIPSDVVEQARQYRAMNFEHLPKVLACDVARFGSDQTVIGWRQGRKSVICDKLRGKDTVQVAQKIAERIESERPDAVVVDGDGLGAGVVDYLRLVGYEDVHEFHGGGGADDSAGLMRDWLKAGAEIPNDPELATDLSGPCYGFSAKQQVQLEKKDDLKKRGYASPDCGDMLAMTFAIRLSSKMPVNKVVTEYRYAGQTNQGWMG